MSTSKRCALAAAVLLIPLCALPAHAASVCGPDGLQASGSIYRICMPAPEDYNGHLMIFAHGYQGAAEPVGIPDGQLQLGDTTLPEIANGLGFGFATNSYSKTGLAVVQGVEDIVDLVDIYSAEQGAPEKIFLIGASEGGLITALLVEQRPDLFAAGVAACGPVGDFAYQIDYIGDARVTFEYFFPGLIPGDPFDPPDDVVADWDALYEDLVLPVVFDPANADLLWQWVEVAGLPFDAEDPLKSVEISVRDVLSYAVAELGDAIETIGGMPFGNRFRWYRGSDNDWQMNLQVVRVQADPAALAEMDAHYDTTGILASPLITLHTLADQQVPHFHEWLYALKTLQSGSLLSEHLHWPVPRFEHCNFTLAEGVISVGLMLFYSGDLGLLSGVGDVLPTQAVAEFNELAELHQLPIAIEVDEGGQDRSGRGGASWLGPTRGEAVRELEAGSYNDTQSFP
jgi:pimeloyl-ACP methyl ester carboxylesterase